MINCNVLYNVNEITVKPGLECSYKKFSKKLNEYLMEKYPKYYIGLQLYQNNECENKFYVIASYKDICGIYEEIDEIGANISAIYDKVWGSCVKRTSVFAFSDYTRIIPPQC